MPSKGLYFFFALCAACSLAGVAAEESADSSVTRRRVAVLSSIARSTGSALPAAKARGVSVVVPPRAVN